MKLSEAIRLGSMLRPQGFQSIAKEGRTCAIGAAYEAVGIDCAALKSKSIPERFAIIGLHLPQVLATDLIPCPACARLHNGVGYTIPHLNDHHRWTREQIADWVETLESAEQPALDEARTVDAVRGSSEKHSLSTRV